MASPGASSLRQLQRGAGLRQPRGETARADPIEDGDSRHVERELQGLAHRNRAHERVIEVLRRIGTVACRPVLDQRFGMNEAILKAHAVDEGLERRAGRAQGLRHVDLAGAPIVEIGRAADMRHNLAGRVIDNQNSKRDVRIERSGKRALAFAREHLQIILQLGIDGKMHLDARRGVSARA